MRKRSAAKSAASSPPSPLRISRMVFFLSFGIGGQEQELDRRLEARRARPASSGSSACASSRSSGSASASSSSRICFSSVAVARERADERLEVAALLVELRRACCGRRARRAGRAALRARRSDARAARASRWGACGRLPRAARLARAGVAAAGAERLVARRTTRRRSSAASTLAARRLLAEERRAEARERDLELGVVRLDGRDLLHEEARPRSARSGPVVQ